MMEMTTCLGTLSYSPIIPPIRRVIIGITIASEKGGPVCYYSVLSLCNVRGSALESLSTPVLGECITYMEEIKK